MLVRPCADRLSIAVVVAVLLTGCTTSGLSLVRDERVTIKAPIDRAKVRLPVTVEWTVKEFDVTGPTPAARKDAGYFGVFVDQAPQPPGKPLAWVAHNDKSCTTVPGCPGAQYLADKEIFTTRATRFVVSQVRDFTSAERQQRREFHQVTIVLLDGRSRRIGESAFSVEFQVIRPKVL
jgi:hypothetical protein